MIGGSRSPQNGHGGRLTNCVYSSAQRRPFGFMLVVIVCFFLVYTVYGLHLCENIDV